MGLPRNRFVSALPRVALAIGVVVLGGGSAPLQQTPAPQSARLPKPPASGEMGFVLTAFSPAIHEGKDDCPEGSAGTVKENYLQSLPAPERARLSLAANAKELTARWQAWSVGSDNTNICSNPELFDHGTQKTVQGKVAYGLDLDGAGDGGAADGCAHANFTGADGRAGVDNQAYRAMGCTRTYRDNNGAAGEIVRGFNNLLATGEQSIVLQLRGVDSLDNDDSVELIVATTDDRPVLDSKRNFINGASFTVGDNPRWRNVLHGRIVDGVLTSDPAEIRLTQRVGQGGIRGKQAEWHFMRARFELHFQPDGSFTGLFGGYQPYREVIQGTILGGVGAATTAGIDCAAQLATLRKMADGMRDPKTGQCTAISTALGVSGVQAYVIDTVPSRGAVASRGI